MRGKKYRCIFIIIADDSLQDKIPRSRIHAGNGLIQNIQVGIPAHNQYKLYFFLGALGKGFQPGMKIDMKAFQHTQCFFLVKVIIKIYKIFH